MVEPGWEPDLQMAISGAVFIRNMDFNIPSESADDEISNYGVGYHIGGPWYML